MDEAGEFDVSAISDLLLECNVGKIRLERDLAASKILGAPRFGKPSPEIRRRKKKQEKKTMRWRKEQEPTSLSRRWNHRRSVAAVGESPRHHPCGDRAVGVRRGGDGQYRRLRASAQIHQTIGVVPQTVRSDSTDFSQSRLNGQFPGGWSTARPHELAGVVPTTIKVNISRRAKSGNGQAQWTRHGRRKRRNRDIKSKHLKSKQASPVAAPQWRLPSSPRNGQRLAHSLAVSQVPDGSSDEETGLEKENQPSPLHATGALRLSTKGARPSKLAVGKKIPRKRTLLVGKRSATRNAHVQVKIPPGPSLIELSETSDPPPETFMAGHSSDMKTRGTDSLSSHATMSAEPEMLSAAQLLHSSKAKEIDPPEALKNFSMVEILHLKDDSDDDISFASDNENSTANFDNRTMSSQLSEPQNSTDRVLEWLQRHVLAQLVMRQVQEIGGNADTTGTEETSISSTMEYTAPAASISPVTSSGINPDDNNPVFVNTAERNGEDPGSMRGAVDDTILGLVMGHVSSREVTHGNFVEEAQAASPIEKSNTASNCKDESATNYDTAMPSSDEETNSTRSTPAKTDTATKHKEIINDKLLKGYQDSINETVENVDIVSGSIDTAVLSDSVEVGKPHANTQYIAGQYQADETRRHNLGSATQVAVLEETHQIKELLTTTLSLERREHEIAIRERDLRLKEEKMNQELQQREISSMRSEIDVLRKGIEGYKKAVSLADAHRNDRIAQYNDRVEETKILLQNMEKRIVEETSKARDDNDHQLALLLEKIDSQERFLHDQALQLQHFQDNEVEERRRTITKIAEHADTAATEMKQRHAELLQSVRAKHADQLDKERKQLRDAKVQAETLQLQIRKLEQDQLQDIRREEKKSIAAAMGLGGGDISELWDDASELSDLSDDTEASSDDLSEGEMEQMPSDVSDGEIMPWSIDTMDADISALVGEKGLEPGEIPTILVDRLAVPAWRVENHTNNEATVDHSEDKGGELEPGELELMPQDSENLTEYERLAYETSTDTITSIESAFQEDDGYG